MTTRLLTALAALLAAALLSGAPALASSTQESIVQDDTLLLERDPATRDRALDDIRMLGADAIRALVIWSRYAPSPDAATPPAGLDTTNPAAYPAGSWDPLDDVVRGATARGLQVLLTPTAPAPRWASPCRSGSLKQRQVCKPDAAAYGAFVRALGTRYSGAYRDENQGGGVLPRVSRWSIWNEPNQPGWLYPQYERRGGRTLAIAAHRYRTLARRGIAGLHASGHRRDQILLGETAPLGRTGGPLGKRAIAPVSFLRELFCVSSSGRRLTGAGARIRGCSSFPRLAVTGYAHHPYTRAATVSPYAGTDSTWITMGSASRLTRLLDQAGRARRIPSRLPVHYTEYGFQTQPPDPVLGVSLKTQAAYMNQSDHIAYRNSRVRSVAQYKIDDDRDSGGFQTGLRFVDGRRKPSWNAYRLSLHVVRSGASRSTVYGQVRPAADGSRETVRIQWRASSRGAFKTIATRTVRSRKGHFTTRVTRRSGEFRLLWVSGTSTQAVSRTARRASR